MIRDILLAAGSGDDVIFLGGDWGLVCRGYALSAGGFSGIYSDPISPYHPRISSIAFSGDGSFMAAYVYALDAVVVYRRSGLSFSAFMTIPVNRADNSSMAIDLSHDGAFLALAYSDTSAGRKFVLFKRTASGYELANEPSGVPALPVIIHTLKFSHSGTYLAAFLFNSSSYTGPHVIIFKRVSDTYQYLTAISDVTATTTRVTGQLRWSPDDTRLAWAMGVDANPVCVSDRVGDTFTSERLVLGFYNPNGGCSGLTWCNSGRSLAVAGGLALEFGIYDAESWDLTQSFAVNSSLVGVGLWCVRGSNLLVSTWWPSTNGYATYACDGGGEYRTMNQYHFDSETGSGPNTICPAI